ncbi:unnamed protein product [Rotaria sp. Silwood2]|nr:unnamed protein product [Rotaria sp. Silwood2]CAF2485610.1 unnamed protein product [Rotaria sp. Silwood2]CAF2869013.1 unnamed protein product [Rotaria sp. Silwood2]CAF4039253.1 unnamed protein product [Rotaria sp. Silwood2]CAF4050615.1 unnamed protein product [Rotaria sp. Silwood2]
MAETTSTFKSINSYNMPSTNSEVNDSLSLASASPRSLSPFNGWTIKYQTLPKKTDSKGVWDGYQTKEEFIMMHIR